LILGSMGFICVVVFPFSVVVEVVLYLNIRVRSEGFNRVKLHQELLLLNPGIVDAMESQPLLAQQQQQQQKQ